MRAWLALGVVLAILTTVVLASCAANDNGGAVGGASARTSSATTTPTGALHAQLPASVAAGALRVGVVFGAAPLELGGGANGPVSGLEPDLVTAAARVLGVPVTFIPIAPGSVERAVAAHRVDLGIGGLVDTRQSRGGGLDFVDELQAGALLLVRKGNPSRLSSLDDLCGRRVGAPTDSAGEASVGRAQAVCSAAHRPAIDVRTGSHPNLLGMLASDQLAAVVDDALVASYTAQVSTAPDELQAVGSPADPSFVGIAVAADNAALRDAVEGAVRSIITDGTYDAVVTRWGGSGEGLRAAAVDAGA